MSGSVLLRTPVVRWLGVVAVTLGIFSIVTAEILPIGLLTPIGEDFGLSPGRTGRLMTAPGLVAAVAAPVVTVTTARLDRRVMLGVLMLVLAGADVPAATVLFTSSFQATLSAGALAGGLLLDRTSVSVVMVCGGLTALVMVGVLLRGDAEHS